MILEYLRTIAIKSHYKGIILKDFQIDLDNYCFRFAHNETHTETYSLKYVLECIAEIEGNEESRDYIKENYPEELL